MVQALFEIVLEVILYGIFHAAIRLPGYLLLRCFYRSSELTIDSTRVVLIGLLLWAIIVGAVIAVVLLA